jgi:hypothetical protein
VGSFIDLTGKQFGRLTVINRTNKTSYGSIIWFCQCDCGSIVEINGASLRYNRTRSCGCLVVESNKAHALPQAARNKVWRMYKQSAHNRCLEFELTAQQFDDLIVGSCYYCGISPAYCSISFAGNKFLHNGIDRLDSSFGYIYSNCVSCCRPCNLMKRATSLTDFLERISIIYQHTRTLPWKI